MRREGAGQLSRSQGRGKARPELETLEARVVPALYNVDVNAYPYSAVCEVEMTFPSGVTYIGSGSLKLVSNTTPGEMHANFDYTEVAQGTTVTARAQFQAATTGRVCEVWVLFYDDQFNFLAGQSFNNSAVTSDVVALELKDEVSQAVMAPVGADGYDYTYVIMPMRV